MTDRETIPTVDLSHYESADAAQRKQFIETLGYGFKQYGFLIVEGHEVEPATVRRSYELAEKVFALPAAVKSQYAGVDGGARGYTPFGIEHAKGKKEPDLKEFWQIGQELEHGHPLREEYHANVWPAEIPEFRDVALGLFRSLEACAGTLLRALAEYLGLPRETFADMIVDGNHVFRFIHYPPIGDDADPNALRAAEHEDINLITLLCEATDGGLEILNREGEWLPVSARPGQIVADSGDMIARVVNDFVPATTHRVVNPVSDRNRSRLSMPFFVHPYSACDLTVMDQFTGEANPPRYPPITAGEYLEERLREIGLKS